MLLITSLLLCAFVAYHWWRERNKRLAGELEIKRLTKIAILDPLTGLYTRRFFEDRAQAIEKEARRYEYSNVVVIFLDLDHFKLVNDHNGHDAGDGVLRGVAKIVQGIVRRNDILAFRWGGEEMLFLGRGDGAIIAERIRSAVAQEPIAGVPVTVSLGVAYFNPLSAEDTIRAATTRADQALLTAKRTGRNCVVVATV